MSSRVIPANIYFETVDEDMVIIEYYPPLKEYKKITLTREKWEELDNRKIR